MSSTTLANTASRLAKDDAPTIPENMHLNLAAGDGSENRQVACAIGTDYPVAGTENDCKVRQLDWPDNPPAPFYSGTTINLATAFISDLRMQFAEPLDRESGEVRMDTAAREGDNKM